MNHTPTEAAIDEQALAHYLLEHPEFFQRHAALLAQVRLGSSHGGGRTIGLHEYQSGLLREQVDALEQRLHEMARNSEDNAATAEKLYAWTCTIVRWPKLHTLPQAVGVSLQHHFNVPQVALRLWNLAEPYAGSACTAGVSEDAKAFAASLPLPFCGPNMGVEPAQWLQAPQQAQSLALLTLRDDTPRPAAPGAEHAFGMLVLASPDPQRFAADMGTDFLQRIAAIASAALSRLR